MRDRRGVFDGKDIEAVVDERADGGIAAGADALYDHRDVLRAAGLDLFRDRRDHFGRCERRRFLGAGETERTGGCPREHVALGVRDGDDGVVVRGIHVDLALLHLLALRFAADAAFVAVASARRQPRLVSFAAASPS